jgi:two-component system chemotaxis sensor kinase CheA
MESEAIQAQIVSAGRSKFAIPQDYLDELVRISAEDIKHRIEKVGSADVIRLRGDVFPLVELSGLLDIDKVYSDPLSKSTHPDRRKNIADRRSPKLNEDGTIVPESVETSEHIVKRVNDDRRFRASSAMNIAMVTTEDRKFGIIIDKFYDSRELVCQQLGRHLSECSAYEGAVTSDGDEVVLVLDLKGVAELADVSPVDISEAVAEERIETKPYLKFQIGVEDHYAVPLDIVSRIEKIGTEKIEEIGAKKVIQYRNTTIPVFELNSVADVAPVPERDSHEIIIFNVLSNEVGLIGTPPMDIVEIAPDIDDSVIKQPGIEGSMIIDGKTTLIVDIFEVYKLMGYDN